LARKEFTKLIKYVIILSEVLIMDEEDEFMDSMTQQLEYGQGAGEVQWAAANEDTTGLNMANLPIYRGVLNIEDMNPEEFALIRRNGFGGSDAAVVVDANPYTKMYTSVSGRNGINQPLVVQKARETLSEEERAVGKLAAVRKGRLLPLAS